MKKWEIRHKIKILDQLTIEEIINILLVNRGISSEKNKNTFLRPSLDSITASSIEVDVKEVKKAIDRISYAIKKQESIVVYTDYDADGITAAAIMWETLRDLGAKVMPYVPHREGEGYGLTQKGIDHIVKTYAVDLIITLDHGVSAQKAIDYARKKGSETIVIDHHLPSNKLPDSVACVHTTALCAGGLSWFVAQELYRRLGFDKKNYEEKVLGLTELAVIATIADLVPLTGANRVLVKYGLSEINQTKRIGLRALFKESGLKMGEIGTYEIGRIIAPRINAMGRLVHALDALRLLCTKDTSRADTLAKLMGDTNRDRQILTQESTLYALTKVDDEKIIFISSERFNQGIIGLVAGKLVEKYYRPSIVVSLGQVYAKASARSVAGYNIVEVLKSASHLLTSVGGHPMAAGFTVESKHLARLRAFLIDHAKTHLGDDLLKRTIRAEMQLPLSCVSMGLFSAISDLSPFGVGNPEPAFVSSGVSVLSAGLVGKTRTHLKMKLRQDNISGHPQILDAIGFGLGEIYPSLSPDIPIDIMYTIDIDGYSGYPRLQLKLKDVRVPPKPKL